MKLQALIALAFVLVLAEAYTYYSGPARNFPSPNKWISFDDMFNRNKGSMIAAGDTWDDVGRIYVASMYTQHRLQCSSAW